MKTVCGSPLTINDGTWPLELTVFCKKLLDQPDKEDMAKRLQLFLRDCPIELAQFKQVEQSYSRSMIWRQNNSYEAMVARWSKGAKTVIHGHPAFGFYYLLHGSFTVENFTRDNESLTKISEKNWLPGEHFTIHGTEGRFDNGIHRITVIEESLSFHIYSDNALKGECFLDVNIL